MGLRRILMVNRFEVGRNQQGKFGDEEGSRCDTEITPFFGRKRNIWAAENF